MKQLGTELSMGSIPQDVTVINRTATTETTGKVSTAISDQRERESATKVEKG